MVDNSNVQPTGLGPSATAVDAQPPPRKSKHVVAAEDLPELLVNPANLSATARELARRFSVSPTLFEMGTDLVKVRQIGDEWRAERFDPYRVVNEAHLLCRPVSIDPAAGLREEITLPTKVAHLLLKTADDRGFRTLRGFCSSPLLSDDGSIRAPVGYDQQSGFWCTGTEMDPVPECPSRDDALAALHIIRTAFWTLPFADSPPQPGPGAHEPYGSPGLDESSMLVGLLTAVCRQSLPFAPGLLVRAPYLSGAGTGKGQVVRAIAEIAYGRQPSAFTSGGSIQELRKRIESVLLGESPVMFLDNCNAAFIASAELAQVITESKMITRRLGKSQMLPIQTSVFIAVTGNGVRIAEDLVRRFILIELDAKCEKPEQRSFAAELGALVRAQRKRLLAAALTIWRWGRQHRLDPGISLGSFEMWGRWCRDPLLALGCLDPVARSSPSKTDDPHREQLAEFFAAWFQHHGSTAVRLEDLHQEVRALAGGGHSRQFLQSFVGRLHGTRAGGFALSIQRSAAKWTPARYVVEEASVDK